MDMGAPVFAGGILRFGDGEGKRVRRLNGRPKKSAYSIGADFLLACQAVLEPINNLVKQHLIFSNGYDDVVNPIT